MVQPSGLPSRWSTPDLRRHPPTRWADVNAELGHRDIGNQASKRRRHCPSSPDRLASPAKDHGIGEMPPASLF
ncbi:hypothetical protein [Dictyobacter kobayashii]|uniref:hypothetical protein n=1 Tax=Dictyobacter kobayashii TaxID=2014872 RepID=UPI000F82AF1A|nr:hypothetical protein [Dictyobacter kobayashii]